MGYVPFVGIESIAKEPPEANGNCEGQARPARYWLRAAVTAGAFGATALLFGSGSFPCVFASLTGVPCPGCGSTRAMYALARGDFGGVLRANPLGPLLTLLLVALASATIFTVFRDGSAGHLGDTRAGRLIARAALGIAILEFFVWGARFFGALGGPVSV